MAYWKFDLTFVNLSALPAGAAGIRVFAIFSVGASLPADGSIPGSGDLTISLDTSEPIFGDPVDLASSDEVWFEVVVYGDPNPPYPESESLAAYMLGPYAVGSNATEVPAP